MEASDEGFVFYCFSIAVNLHIGIEPQSTFHDKKRRVFGYHDKVWSERITGEKRSANNEQVQNEENDFAGQRRTDDSCNNDK